MATQTPLERVNAEIARCDQEIARIQTETNAALSKQAVRRAGLVIVRDRLEADATLAVLFTKAAELGLISADKA